MKAADLDILLQEGEGAMLEYKENLSLHMHPASTPEVTGQVAGQVSAAVLESPEKETQS